MPDVKYPKNPNSDTAFVEEDGKRTRAIKVAVVDGTIDYPKNANSDSCYVTIDGKKQRALMVADVSGEGTVEYPNNPNSTKGYVEIDGKKQRVVLTASLAGGGSTPTGTITITSNGEHDVTDYATADVQVPEPTGTITITGNGITDVTNYASADVQVPTSAPAHYLSFVVDGNGVITRNEINSSFFNGVTEIGAYALDQAQQDSSAQGSGVLDLGTVTTIRNYGMNNAFYNSALSGVVKMNLTGGVSSYGLYWAFSSCPNITEAEIGGRFTNNVCFQNCFQGCTGLTKLKILPDTWIGNNFNNDEPGYGSGNLHASSAFSGCTSLATLDLDGLIGIGRPNSTSLPSSSPCRNMFNGDTSITTASFGGLTYIEKYGLVTTFSGCTNLVSLSFPALTSNSFDADAFVNMLSSVANVTVHFPSNVQAAVETTTGYSTTAPYGATAGTVLFDLPATIALQATESDSGNQYNFYRFYAHDTANALAWNKATSYIPYYTSGLSNPSASDTIYSDAACTIPFATIDAILS